MEARKEMILNIQDVKASADRQLDPAAREFFNSGSTEQVTVAENSTAYSQYRQRPRVLVDVSKVDATTTVLGHKIDFPLSVSPAGQQVLAHSEGELATSRACGKRNVLMGVSSYANHSVEEIVQAGLEIGPVGYAMQLYSMKDRDMQKRIIRRAEKVGCKAIFLTADSPILGLRYHEKRNQFHMPEGIGLPMLEADSKTIRSINYHKGFVNMNKDAHSWAIEIPYLRSVTKMQIWIKGVLTAEDVQLAREYGCDGVLVSNHGGRQLDGTVTTIEALPECVEAAAGKIRVHVDGGIRSGTDIFKAVALGAECCWIGRPVIWGLAHDGERGVSEVLDILYSEFLRCMQLTGSRSVADIGPNSVRLAGVHRSLARL